MKQFLVLFFLLYFLSQCESKRYTYYTYDNALATMKQLATNYPRFVQLFDAKKENKYIFDTPCGNKTCEHWYLQITDFNQSDARKSALPQVFLLAGIHGDEVIGVNTLLYLAEYLMEKNGVDQDITNLIKSRMLILLPLANPSGFYSNRRGENQNGAFIDPNRDFPYNVPANTCLTTASARVINHIFRKYLIQSTITFHGGERSITYPWGAFNHIVGTSNKAQESPDDLAFVDIAHILSKEAGNNPFMSLSNYPTGRMTDIVYAVNGGLEDWSYAASWEKQFNKYVIPHCAGIPDSETEYNDVSLRTLIYLVEASYPKKPIEAYLGSSEGLEPYGDKSAYGHIPMNIRLSLAFLDLVEPYVKLKGFDYSEENQTLKVQWQGGGCKSVDSTSLWYTNTADAAATEKETASKSGPGYYENKDFYFEEIIDLKGMNDDFDLNLIIKVSCDQKWAKQVAPMPNTTAVTHVVRARINQNYKMEGNGYVVTGKQIVSQNHTGITRDYLLKTKLVNPRDIKLVVEVKNCSGFEKIGSIGSQLVGGAEEATLKYDGKLSFSSVSVEGHLYQYGDVTMCKTNIGSPINNVTFQSAANDQASLLFKLDKSNNPTDVDYKAKMLSEQDIFGFIGRSILITDVGSTDNTSYVGQILPFQPDSCRSGDDMKGCIGFDMQSRDGICIIKPAENDKRVYGKLFISTSSDDGTIKLSGYVPNSPRGQSTQFNEVYIVNENNKQKVTLNNKLHPNYGFIEDSTFPLHSTVALGNILRIYAENTNGKMLLLGDCSISLRDPNQLKINRPPEVPVEVVEPVTPPQEDGHNAFKISVVWILWVGGVLVVFGIIFLLILYKRSTRQKLELGMFPPRAPNDSQGKDHIELVESDDP